MNGAGGSEAEVVRMQVAAAARVGMDSEAASLGALRQKICCQRYLRRRCFFSCEKGAKELSRGRQRQRAASENFR